MTDRKLKNSIEEFEKAAARSVGYTGKYTLRLYISGMTSKSLHAVENIRKICEEHLKGRYDLQIIDIYKNPVLAKGEQIIAAPTLIKKLPLPLRRIIGDMSNTDRVLLGLDLRRKTDEVEAQKHAGRRGKDMEPGERGKK